MRVVLMMDTYFRLDYFTKWSGWRKTSLRVARIVRKFIYLINITITP